jgi:hypothetical protein
MSDNAMVKGKKTTTQTMIDHAITAQKTTN